MTAHAHRHNNDRCGHHHNARVGGDTTHTQTIQAEYARRLRGHLRRLMVQIRDDVGERDVLGLAGDDRSVGGLGTQQSDPTRAPSFEFGTAERKREMFGRWFDDQLSAGVLSEVGEGENRYARSAYERGIKNADTRIRSQGVDVGDGEVRLSMRMPTHQNRLRQLYTRNYELLEGIAEDMSDDIGDELARAFAEGVGPEEAARRISDRVDAVGLTRATTLARTEVMNAHHSGTIARYQEFGVDKVDILVSAPCEMCQAIAADAPYALSNARGILPAHPNCICSYAPVVDRR